MKYIDDVAGGQAGHSAGCVSAHSAAYSWSAYVHETRVDCGMCRPHPDHHHSLHVLSDGVYFYCVDVLIIYLHIR